MDYSYEQLKEMTVAQLREIAKGIQNDELEGHSVMHKEQLLPLLCKVLGIHIHHVATGGEKAVLKARMRKLKAQLHDGAARPALAQASIIRREVHRLEHVIRKMAAQA